MVLYCGSSRSVYCCCCLITTVPFCYLLRPVPSSAALRCPVLTPPYVCGWFIAVPRSLFYAFFTLRWLPRLHIPDPYRVPRRVLTLPLLLPLPPPFTTRTRWLRFVPLCSLHLPPPYAPLPHSPFRCCYLIYFGSCRDVTLIGSQLRSLLPPRICTFNTFYVYWFIDSTTWFISGSFTPVVFRALRITFDYPVTVTFCCSSRCGSQFQLPPPHTLPYHIHYLGWLPHVVVGLLVVPPQLFVAFAPVLIIALRFF